MKKNLRKSLVAASVALVLGSVGVGLLVSSPLQANADNPSYRDDHIPYDPDSALINHGQYYFNYTTLQPVLSEQVNFVNLERDDIVQLPDIPSLIWLPYSVSFSFSNSADTEIEGITLIYSVYNPSMQATTISDVYPFWGFTRAQNNVRDWYSFGSYAYCPFTPGNPIDYGSAANYYGKNFLVRSGYSATTAVFNWSYLKNMFAPFVDRLRVMVANNLIDVNQGLKIYNDGYNDGDTAGYRRGYNVGYTAGQNSVSNDMSTFTSLFGAIVDVPINVLNGLAPMAIWGTPLIYIAMSFLFLGVVLWVVKLFI